MTDWTVSVSRDIAADATTLYELVTDVPRMGEWSPENHTCIWKEGFDRAALSADVARYLRRHAVNHVQRQTLVSPSASISPAMDGKPEMLSCAEAA